MRYFLIWLVALVLAAVSAVAALGAVTKGKLPHVAATLWPVNGFALAQLADNATKDAAIKAGTAPRGSPQGLPAIGRSVSKNGRRAFAAEPTSIVAIRTLALQKQAEGKGDEARRLMRYAHLLNKRNIFVNFWLIEDYSAKGDIANTLSIYDHTLRTVNYERKGKLLTIMANALANETLIEPYYLLLKKNPPWANAFWRQAAQTASAIGNAGRLRMRLAQRGIHPSDEIEHLLLTALVDQKKFDDAWQIDRIRSGVRAGPPDVIRNSDFSETPGLPPFDWRFISSGDLGAGINPEAGSLEISVVPGGRGVVAQQLIRLSPGRYALQAIARSGSADSVERRVEIRCAEGPGKAIRLNLDASNNPQMADLSGQSCDYYWLDLSVIAAEGSGGGDVELDSLTLKKVA